MQSQNLTAETGKLQKEAQLKLPISSPKFKYKTFKIQSKNVITLQCFMSSIINLLHCTMTLADQLTEWQIWQLLATETRERQYLLLQQLEVTVWKFT